MHLVKSRTTGLHLDAYPVRPVSEAVQPVQKRFASGFDQGQLTLVILAPQETASEDFEFVSQQTFVRNASVPHDVCGVYLPVV